MNKQDFQRSLVEMTFSRDLTCSRYVMFISVINVNSSPDAAFIFSHVKWAIFMSCRNSLLKTPDGFKPYQSTTFLSEWSLNNQVIASPVLGLLRLLALQQHLRASVQLKSPG